MNKTSKQPPERLADLLTKLLRNLGVERKVKESEVISKWPNIVGPRISNVTTPKKTDKGILFVKVKGSAWKNELIFLKMNIITKIDKAVGTGIIKDIRFM